MPSIKESITVNSSADKVFKVIRAVEDYCRFIPSIKWVKVLDTPSDNVVISEWDTEIDGIPFHWIERDEYDPSAYSVRYQLVEGDMEKFEGQWQIDSSNDGVRLELTVEYSMGLPSLEELVGLVMHENLVVSAKELLSSIKRESEVV